MASKTLLKTVGRMG